MNKPFIVRAQVKLRKLRVVYSISGPAIFHSVTQLQTIIAGCDQVDISDRPVWIHFSKLREGYLYYFEFLSL